MDSKQIVKQLKSKQSQTNRSKRTMSKQKQNDQTEAN